MSWGDGPDTLSIAAEQGLRRRLSEMTADRDAIRAELERTKEELERVRRNHLRNQLRRAELAAKTFAYVARQDPAHSTSTPRRLRRAARNRDRWRKVVEAIRAALERKDGASHGA